MRRSDRNWAGAAALVLALKVKLNNYNKKEGNEATEKSKTFYKSGKNMMPSGDSFGSGASIYSPMINLDK